MVTKPAQLRGEPTRWTALVYLLTYLEAWGTTRTHHNFLDSS
jgi:hypothetical protein